ncbi:MAG: hypothetical protein JO336_19070 [Acidobacteriia bacterium]|nr:hypothetical protein [Terriglobia bacterium]
MNLVHVHLLLNHFPTIGMVVGLCVFVAAFGARSDDLKRASLGIFFFIALLSIPTFVTGTSAQLALENHPEASKAAIAAHKNAAFLALGFMELTGALSWLGLWQYRRLSRWPRGTLAAVLLLGIASFGFMAQAATLGGEIRHPEILTDPAAAQSAKDAATLVGVIGDAMVNQKWCWAAGETVHFIGLCLLFGVVLLTDLRMMGFLKGIPFSVLHRLLPWGILGFGVNVVTGIFFFVGAPPTFYVTNPTFFWKLALILVAGANALYFTAFERPWMLGAGEQPPMITKVAAASGILLWVGVIFCGQMLPFLGRSF